jgi:hypothetical protein
MDSNANELLNELGLKGDTKGRKKTDQTTTPDTTTKPAIHNAGADDLLNELSIPKKKSTSQGSSDGQSGSQGASDGQGSSQSTPVQSPDYGEMVKQADEFIRQDYSLNRKALDPSLAAAGYGRDQNNGSIFGQSKPQPYPYGPKQEEKPFPKPGTPEWQQMENDQLAMQMGDMQRSEKLKTQPLPPNDTRFLEAITNGDTKALSTYYKSRISSIDDQMKVKEREIEAKYPMKMQVVSAGADITRMVRSNQAGFDQEMSQLHSEFGELKSKVEKSVDLLMDKKIVDEAKKQATPFDQRYGKYLSDTEKLGKKKMELMGDPDIEKWDRYEKKGLPVPDAVKYNMDKLGVSIAQSAIMQDMKNRGTYNDKGELVSIPDDLKDAIKEVQTQSNNLLTKHSDFRKEQVARAISDKIYKDKNWFQTMTGAYTINQDDIKKAAKDLGFDEKLVADVKPGDIKTANIFGTFVNELAVKPGAGIGSAITRNFRKIFLGQDEDYVDAHTDFVKQKFSALLADQPDAQNLFGNDVTVDINKGSNTFLEDVKNPQKGKFNWGVGAIANTISSGFGQLLTYATGGNTFGKGFQALNMFQKGNAARNAGLVTYAFITQYDDNYKEAKDMGIKDEAAANGFAAIRSLASGFTEMIFPDYKVTDALFGTKSAATKMFMDRIAKKGLKGLTEQNMKPIFKKALMEGLKDTGKETLEEEADQMADVLTTALFKPEALQNRDVPRELFETGVTTAISTILPVTAGTYNEHRGESRLIKNMTYHVGLNPAQYIEAVQDLADSGRIKQDEADKRIKVINTLNGIVSTLPGISSETGRPLTEDDKVEYTNNLLKEKLLDEQLEKVKGDKVQEKNISSRISELQKQRQDIVDHADGVEVNGEGKPVMEGDDRVIITPENKELVQEYDEKIDNAETPKEKETLEKELKDKVKELQQKTEDETNNRGDEEAGQTSDNPIKKEEKGQVLKEPAPDKTEELELLPTKQREKMKAKTDQNNDQVKEATEVIKKYPDGLKGTFADMAKKDPVGTLKMIAEQSQGISQDGTQVADLANEIAVREKAEKMYGKELVTKAIEMFPKKSPEAKPKDSPAPKPKGESADVVYAPTSDINTDVERFQPRGTDYSKESANKIIENFDDNRLDPVVLYNDRKDGKSYVLAGHSRLEAHNQLEELPDTDPRKKAAIEKGYQPGKIKARYFNGTEAEAKEFADRSNDLGTKNKDYESANSLRKMREAGKTKKEITDRAKEDFGKNWRYLNNLSYLNPHGKILETLKQFESNPDKDTQAKIEKAGQWIGAVRERLGESITNAHENEMFDFLMDKTRSTKLERENDFIALVQNITGRFDYNPNEPLNLARLKTKTVGEVSHDQEEREIKQSIKDKEAELDNLSDRLNNPKNPAYVNPNSPDYSDVLRRAEAKKQGMNQELTALRKELLQHQQNKGKVLAEGMNQTGLFDMNNLTPTEATELNEELKDDGITVENIKDYEQSISDSSEVSQTGTDEHSKTGTVQEGVQQPGNDESGVPQQDKSGSERKTVTDPKLQEKIDKKNAALAKFRKAVGGNLNVGLNPEAITAGVELMVAMADLGIYKFGKIVRDIINQGAKDFVTDPNGIEALKGVYSYYRANISKEERRKFDNEDEVDKVIAEEFLFFLKITSWKQPLTVVWVTMIRFYTGGPLWTMQVTTRTRPQ